MHANATPRARFQHISVDAMLKKMKALWQSSKAVVAREEGRAPAKTGEGTMSAAEACADGGESEVSLRSGYGRECNVGLP